MGTRVLTAGGRTGGRKWVLEYSQRVDGPAGAISEMYRFASDDDTPTLKWAGVIRPPRAHQTDAAEPSEKAEGGMPTAEGRRRKAYLIPVSARAATTTQNEGASAMPARGARLRVSGELGF